MDLAPLSSNTQHTSSLSLKPSPTVSDSHAFGNTHFTVLLSADSAATGSKSCVNECIETFALSIADDALAGSSNHDKPLLVLP